MLAALSVTVHTTGVNWEGIAVNAAIIVGGVAIIARFLANSLRRTIQQEITEIVHKEVSPKLEAIDNQLKVHDTRLARLEGIEEGKRQAIDQAGVSRTPT